MAVAISKRGDVEPFHAMDVLAEANRLKAPGQPIVSMAVGQPSDPAPRSAFAMPRAQALVGRPHRLHGRARPCNLREAISEHYAEHYNIGVSAEPHCGDDRLVGRLQPGLPGNVRPRRPRRHRGARLPRPTATSWPRSDVEVVEIELTGAGVPDAEHLRDTHATAPLKGVLFASPANPTGAVIPPATCSELVETAAATRHRGDLRRDLSPSGLLGARRDRA